MTGATETYVTSVVDLIADYLVATGHTRDKATENTGAEFVNNVFEIRAHNWDDDASYEPNFYFTEYDFTLVWHKHLSRGTMASGSMTADQALYMLRRCIDSIVYGENVPHDSDGIEWDETWDQEPEEDVNF